ncbi:uncharacterized protein LOC110466741 [Mizuhopecten yessoensis]|uniref:uncharacterized protein LOC110466741 n=1 Tax=Mizuhopecten yessoensis TaxID=6573 RepID=UPI000B45DDD9|nr:uncharacterized protein LOC110466741 [Mizuhopecten yessoensis]
MLHILLILCTGLFIHCTEGTCTFPTSLTDGTWISAEKGNLQISGTSILKYPMDISGVATFDFNCIVQSDTTYLFQAVEFQNVFGVITRFFLCLDIHEVNGNVLTYFLGTEYDVFVRDFIFPLAEDIATMAQACNRATPYETHTFITLVKTGSVDDGSAPIKCPDDVLSVFDDVAIADQTCANSILDVCSNQTQMNFTLDAPCATEKTLATAGQYTCIHHITSGQTTYLSLWNNDASPTYQFSCFAFQRVDDVVTATETAKYCTATTDHVTPGTQDSVTGKTIVVNTPSQSCIAVGPTAASGPDAGVTINYNGLYALLLIPLYILLSLLILLILCCCCGYSKKKKKTTEKHRPESPIIVISKAETSNLKFGMRSELYMKRGHFGLFRPKKSLVIPSHPSFLPCVLPLPRVEPIYKDPFLLDEPATSTRTVEPLRTLKPPSSPGIGGLYSFDAVDDIMGR